MAQQIHLTTIINMFEELLTNAKAVEEKYIGQNYPYYRYITPLEI